MGGHPGALYPWNLYTEELPPAEDPPSFLLEIIGPPKILRMTPEYFLRSLLMIILAVFSANASNWLYLAKLSSVGSISEEETCEKLKGLIQRQVQMCKRNLEVMDSVRRGGSVGH